MALVVFQEHIPKWNCLSRQLFLHLNHLMNNDQHTLYITRYLVGAPLDELLGSDRVSAIKNLTLKEANSRSDYNWHLF